MEKQELFRIGEVARMFSISVGSLRHYEKLGLIRPEYTDPDSGYRYYGVQQFERLNTIRYLRALNMPLEDIADFLQNKNVGKIQEMLIQQRKTVRQKQQELQIIEQKINTRLEGLADALSSRLDTITLIHTLRDESPGSATISLRKPIWIWKLRFGHSRKIRKKRWFFLEKSDLASQKNIWKAKLIRSTILSFCSSNRKTATRASLRNSPDRPVFLFDSAEVITKRRLIIRNF